jgi:hypothetical protein
MRTIFVVSSKHLLNDAGLASQPLAGNIFAVDPGIKGIVDSRFAG